MKKLLIVVDYQVDFVSGALGFPKARALEGPIAQKIREYQAGGHDVAFTLDTHDAGYAQTQEGRLLPVAHCLRGTPGWELYGRVGALAAGCARFEKGAFGSRELFRHLESHPYGEIELCGLVSSICVLSNAVLAKTAQPETPVVVDASCTGAGDEALHASALDILENVQVRVINRPSRE